MNLKNMKVPNVRGGGGISALLKLGIVGGIGCVNNDGGRVVNDDGVEGDGRHDGCGGIVCVCLCQCYQWRMAEHGGRLKFCHINTPLHLMAGLPSQIAYGGWQKIRHNIVPWLLFYNTGLCQTFTHTIHLGLIFLSLFLLVRF